MKCTVVAELWKVDGSRETRYARAFDNYKDAKAHFEEIEDSWSDPNVHCDIIVNVDATVQPWERYGREPAQS
jgi:hypothetical protein